MVIVSAIIRVFLRTLFIRC